MPKTKQGRVSLTVFTLAVILFLIATVAVNTLYVNVGVVNTIVEDFTLRPVFVFSMLASLMMIFVSWVLAIKAFCLGKDRSWLLVMVMVVGALVLVFFAGELLVPH